MLAKNALLKEKRKHRCDPVVYILFMGPESFPLWTPWPPKSFLIWYLVLGVTCFQVS